MKPTLEETLAQGASPQVRYDLAVESYHAALGQEKTTPKDIYDVFERCGVVVTNLEALEELRGSK